MSSSRHPNLIPGLVAGQPAAYATLYDHYGPSLLKVSRTLLGSTEEAEDAVQDLFVDLLVHSRHRLEQVEDLRAYLFASLRHAVNRRIARRESQKRVLGQIAVTKELLFDQPKPECDDEIKIALAALPQVQREVIALKTEGALTFVQIGQILDISANTAASRYRYALEKLRKSIEERRHD